eukprot:snap_masked-scaffold_1-processed-gene-6.36-mRNA-1 protein AED:1.00 eAED:1.00 QI:0/-1/0/0/-1/1/1/0/71
MKQIVTEETIPLCIQKITHEDVVLNPHHEPINKIKIKKFRKVEKNAVHCHIPLATRPFLNRNPSKERQLIY